MGKRIFLDDFGLFLGRRRNRFVVRERGKTIEELPADDVEAIVLSSKGVSMSEDALRLAIDKRIQIVHAYHSGWPYAFTIPTFLSGSVETRREQFLSYKDERGVELAKAFVVGKLTNQANLLRLLSKSRRRTQPEVADELYNLAIGIQHVVEGVEGNIRGDDIDLLRLDFMSLEAGGAKFYWSGVAKLVPKEFDFTGRDPNKTDPLNILLNYGYGILYSEVWKAVHYAGLDPFAGFLHADRPGKPSLVLDLIEEFRQQVVDRTLFALIARKKLDDPNVFEKGVLEKGKPILSKLVRQLVANGLIDRLSGEVTFEGKKLPLTNFIHRQARKIARYLRGTVRAYTPFVQGW